MFNSATPPLSRDSADDYRALIRPVVGTISQITLAEEPLHTQAKRNAVFNANYAYIVFVNSMTVDSLNDLRGEADSIGGDNIIVNWNPATPAPETIVHEYGHTKGLEHGSAGVDENNIMCAGTANDPAPARKVGANRLKFDQIDEFEN